MTQVYFVRHTEVDYKLADGESLREVANRNISALNDVLSQYEGKNIVVGSHGTGLGTRLCRGKCSVLYALSVLPFQKPLPPGRQRL